MFPLWAWWGENTSASLRRITDSWFFVCKNLPSLSLCLREAPVAEAPAVEASVLGAGWSVRCPPAGPGKSHLLLCPYSAITGSPVGGDGPPRHPVHTTQALRGPHWGADGRWGKWNRQERVVWTVPGWPWHQRRAWPAGTIQDSRQAGQGAWEGWQKDRGHEQTTRLSVVLLF